MPFQCKVFSLMTGLSEGDSTVSQGAGPALSMCQALPVRLECIPHRQRGSAGFTVWTEVLRLKGAQKSRQTIFPLQISCLKNICSYLYSLLFASFDNVSVCNLAKILSL